MPSGMSWTAIAIAITRLSFMLVTLPIAMAMPSGKLCRNIPMRR